MTMLLLSSFLLLVSGIWVQGAQGQYYIPPCQNATAICRVRNGTVSGDIQLETHEGVTTVYGSLGGLSAGQHGFHVHQFGDLSNGCNNAGEHYNPFNLTHGAETDIIRHVGDMGNIDAGSDGVAYIYKVDYEIQLCGPLSVMGRALVVHAQRDDLGRGGNEESLINGNSGMRIGCCVIAVSKPPQ